MSTLLQSIHAPGSQVAATAACPVCGESSIEFFLRAPDRFHARNKSYELIRCKGCGLVRLPNPPDPEEMAFHYGDGYHSLIENAGETELARRWKRQRSTVLSLKPEGTLLDIGCSSGAFLSTLKNSSWRLHGIEISEEEAAKARTAAAAQVFVGDPLDAPFAPETFDVITCFHLLEHVYQPVELLKRAQRWLKRGGSFYVVLPNIDSWEATLFQSYWYGLELPRHLFHFSPRSLERATRSAHLQTVKLHTLWEDSFSEHSFHYLFENLLGRIGLPQAPLSAGRPASLPLKVLRKSFRLSAELTFKTAASIAGKGASIEGLFVKSN